MKRRTLLQGVLAFFGLSRVVRATPATFITDWHGESTLAGHVNDPANIVFDHDARKFKNYTTAYTPVSKDELLQKMRDAMTRTTFIPPVAVFATGEDRDVVCVKEPDDETTNVVAWRVGVLWNGSFRARDACQSHS